jgi:hypothetical protein
VEAPKIEVPKEAPKVEVPKEAPKAEVPKVEAPKVEVPKVEAHKGVHVDETHKVHEQPKVAEHHHTAHHGTTEERFQSIEARLSVLEERLSPENLKSLVRQVLQEGGSLPKSSSVADLRFETSSLKSSVSSDSINSMTSPRNGTVTIKYSAQFFSSFQKI